MKDELHEFNRQVGQNLAYYRKRNGLTQENLAEKLNVNSRTVSRVENAGQRTNLDFFYKASIVMSIPVSRFFEFRGEQIPE